MEVDRERLVKTLLEDPSEVNRSRAHYDLGRLAVAEHAVERAARHFREAADLDPTDEQPIRALKALGDLTDEAARPTGTFLGRLFAGFRRANAR